MTFVVPSTVICNIVSDESGVVMKELMGDRHTWRCAWPRQLAMLLVRRYSKMSYPGVGEAFKRNHSTIMYGCQAAEDRRLAVPHFDALYKRCVARIECWEHRQNDLNASFLNSRLELLQ